jgi:pyrimidine deaminase RibD-like protein
MRIKDFRIHSTGKLDKILVKCCELILDNQKQDSEYWGMVGACLLDSDNRAVFGVNHLADNGKRKHAERVAIDSYIKKYGELDSGSIIITTLSPCSDDMDERYGESCTELINDYGIHKVYCGYKDPSQIDSEAYLHKKFHCMETRNDKIKLLCKRFADTFLDKLS